MTDEVTTLWRNAHLFAFAHAQGWGEITQGAMITRGETIEWVGDESALPKPLEQSVAITHNLHGACVTPALIDCHTHLVYAGNRAHEFEMRLKGVSYEEIAKAGGGIRSTVFATRAASETNLVAEAAKRARALMYEGVATIEIKSGYGLTERDEARCLRGARAIGKSLGITVCTTYLGAHAVPPEYEGRSDDYIDAVCAWMPALHAQGLIDAVDAFCERIAFTPTQTRRVYEAAKQLRLPVKLHAEQLSDQDGAALAAEFSALSCDHLEYVNERGVAAMKKAGTVAVLLPGAYYFLREQHAPPISLLRQYGVPIALATDHNPGTSPTLSPLLMMNMGCVIYRLTPEEVWRGFTVNAAKALGLEKSHGVLREGMRADFAVWDAAHIRELAYSFGHRPLQRLVIGGELVVQ